MGLVKGSYYSNLKNIMAPSISVTFVDVNNEPQAPQKLFQGPHIIYTHLACKLCYPHHILVFTLSESFKIFLYFKETKTREDIAKQIRMQQCKQYSVLP